MATLLHPAAAGGEAAGLGDAELQALSRFRQQLLQGPGLKAALVERSRRSRWWLLADAALVAGGLVSGQAVWVAAGAIAAAVPFAYTAIGWRHADRYQRLLRQFALGHWDTVRVLAKELRGVSARNPLLDFDLDVRLAGIYARERSLDDALARLEPWRERLARDPGVFESRVATVHLMAGDTAGFVRLTARAHAQSPDQPARTLEHALAQARFGDIAQAAALLQELDAGTLPPLAQGALHWARGLLQLRLKQPAAEAMLARAAADLLRLSSQPVVWTALASCVCDLAVAVHQAGRHDDARRHIAEVWPILEVHATVPLLRMLEADDLLPITGRPTRTS